MRTVRLGEPWRLSETDLVAPGCIAVSGKSLFIQGIPLTRSSVPESGQGSRFVHVLDEWAKVAPDTAGSVFGSDWLSQTDRICLISTYGREWLRKESAADRVADFCGFSGVCDRWVFCMGSILPWRVDRAQQRRPGWCHSLPPFVIIAQAPWLGPGITDHMTQRRGRHGTTHPTVRSHRP